MAFAPGSQLRFAHVVEVTPGTTPATPAFAVSRVTKIGGGAKKTTSVSDEMQPDRNVRGIILEGIDVDGTYDFELSYGTFDAIFESVLQGAWTTNVLKNGTTRKYFTFEEADLAGTSSFFRHKGSIVDELSLSLQARKKITGSFRTISMQEEVATTAISGATYTAANTNAIMTSGAAIGALSLTGLTTQPKIKSLDLKIGNGLTRREKLTSLYTDEPFAGQVSVTGTVVAYLESTEFYALAVAHGSVALSCQLGLSAGSKYQIDIPVARLVNQDRSRNGPREDQMVSIEFQGEYDSTLGGTIKLTRAV